MEHQELPARCGHHVISPLSRFAVPVLWISAGVLLGLLFFRGTDSEGMQVVRGFKDSARAGMVSHSGNYAILTNETNNEDVVVVLDGRIESLMLYRTDQQNGIELLQKIALPRVFEDAKLRSARP